MTVFLFQRGDCRLVHLAGFRRPDLPLKGANGGRNVFVPDTVNRTVVKSKVLKTSLNPADFVYRIEISKVQRKFIAIFKNQAAFTCIGGHSQLDRAIAVRRRARLTPIDFQDAGLAASRPAVSPDAYPKLSFERLGDESMPFIGRSRNFLGLSFGYDQNVPGRQSVGILARLLQGRVRGIVPNALAGRAV